MISTTTVELRYIKGYDDPKVHCTHVDCDEPAAYAIVAPLQKANCLIYEMQPYCARHYRAVIAELAENFRKAVNERR